MKKGTVKILHLGHRNGTGILNAGDSVTENDVDNFDLLVDQGKISPSKDYFSIKADEAKKAEDEQKAKQAKKTEIANKAKKVQKVELAKKADEAEVTKKVEAKKVEPKKPTPPKGQSKKV